MPPTAEIPADLDAAIEEYRRLRPIMTRLHTEISRLIRKDDLFACAKRLQMLSRQNGKKVIMFENELEVDIFQDYQIYMHRPHSINAVQQMVNRNRYPEESDEWRLLEGMAKARFSVFMVKEIIKNAGFVGVDIQSGAEFFLMDLTLPRQNAVGFLIGFRIFPFGGYWMHTGANLPLAQSSGMVGFKPIGKVETVTEERDLNEGIIFSWRSLVSEMDD